MAVVSGPRQTGIDVIGLSPWGTHLSHFYETIDDLLEALLPYFAAGPATNEQASPRDDALEGAPRARPGTWLRRTQGPNRRLAMELLDGKRDSFTMTKRNRRKDGSVMWASIHVCLIPGAEEDTTLFMSIVDDITERKRAEETLRKAEAELAHVTRVTTLGELATWIAHEVNQPLAAIVADANACLNWLTATAPRVDDTEEALVDIVNAGHRAGEVIERIRHLARPQPARHAPDRSRARAPGRGGRPSSAFVFAFST